MKIMEVEIVSSPNLITLSSNDNDNIVVLYDTANDKVFLPEEAYKKVCQKLDKDPEIKAIKINIVVDYDSEISSYSDIIELIKEYINRF